MDRAEMREKVKKAIRGTRTISDAADNILALIEPLVGARSNLRKALDIALAFARPYDAEDLSGSGADQPICDAEWNQAFAEIAELVPDIKDGEEKTRAMLRAALAQERG